MGPFDEDDEDEHYEYSTDEFGIRSRRPVETEWCFTCGDDCTCDQMPARIHYDLM